MLEESGFAAGILLAQALHGQGICMTYPRIRDEFGSDDEASLVSICFAEGTQPTVG